MAWIYELRFQPSGDVKEILTPGNDYYVLADGRRVEMHQHYVWCFGCNDFSWAEWLLLREGVEQSIKIWEDPDSEERKAKLKKEKFPDQKQYVVARELGRAYGVRDLLLARTEPCHCTKCGSTEFIEVLDDVEFPLPDGSGTVTMIGTSHASVAYRPTYYTPNGHRMSLEEVPPGLPVIQYPQHIEWTDILLWLVMLVTIPIWGSIALLVLAVMGIRRTWNYARRHNRDDV